MQIIPTPLTDNILSIYTFKTKEGFVLNDTITYGQKLIMECILGRKAPAGVLVDGVLKFLKRIHVMAHTRYGKSMAIAAAICVRASAMHEPWAIVAGTTDQAQIIMDYVIQFSVNDPILKAQLVNEKEIKIERLTQRRKRDHITYKMGGEVRAYGAGRDGNAVMGQGCPNVVEDESALISNESQSKIFRMLGDHMDNFYMKVGNPFNNNHFKEAYKSTLYYHININYHQGIADGRLTDEFVSEARQNPNFSILYENIFPDAEKEDEWGWTPLFTDSLLRHAYTKEEKWWGKCRDGCDPADDGECEAVIVRRWANLAKMLYADMNCDNISFATEIAVRNRDTDVSIIDSIGVGSGTFNLLDRQMGVKEHIQSFKGGAKVPESVPKIERENYFNLRAYCFWQIKIWLENGGKLWVQNEGNEEKWKQLLEVRYKVTDRSQIQIIGKKELAKRYAVKDLGWADGLSMTFMPVKPRQRHHGVRGGVRPINSSLGL